jgi:hypothetical protein
MRIHLICLSIIVLSASHASGENSITFYRDGALIRQEARAVKGVIDISLPDGLLEHSLTVLPTPGTTILDVKNRMTGIGATYNKEFESLTEQRLRLEDRLKALETREAIFTSAAKTQSGKAPRKTKANPDPMKSIRQGTDFAIAQLESVYTARRTTTQEIHKIDLRLAASRKKQHAAEVPVRIAVTPPRGIVTLRYATTERGWQARYNLYLAGDGTAELKYYANITGQSHRYQTRISSGSLVESATAATFPSQSGTALLASYRLPITEERSVEGIFNSYSGLIRNSTQYYLPSGESGLFRNGAYLGKFRFEGISSGRSRVITVGR